MSLILEKVVALKDVALFTGVEEQALVDLIAFSREKNYTPGEVIIEADTEIQALFVILSGHVQFKMNKNVFMEMGPRQFFGETSVFHKNSFPYAVVAQDDTTLLRIPPEALYQVMALYPSLATAFIGNLSLNLHKERLKNLPKV